MWEENNKWTSLIEDEASQDDHNHSDKQVWRPKTIDDEALQERQAICPPEEVSTQRDEAIEDTYAHVTGVMSHEEGVGYDTEPE